ncbi:hypothetical protein [Limnospira platensis]|uniref:hypothetical protein n=2 Tax=Limnospira TaxID=2596745 RepID=UPI001683A12F
MTLPLSLLATGRRLWRSGVDRDNYSPGRWGSYGLSTPQCQNPAACANTLGAIFASTSPLMFAEAIAFPWEANPGDNWPMA